MWPQSKFNENFPNYWDIFNQETPHEIIDDDIRTFQF